MLGRAASGVLGRTASGILERRNKVTAEELLANSDLTGKTVVVTGGNSGRARRDKFRHRADSTKCDARGAGV